MQFDNTNGIADITENVMAAVRSHLLPDEPNHPCHYNAAFSAVYETLSLNVTRMPTTGLPKPRQGPVLLTDKKRIVRNLGYLERKGL